MERGGGGRGGGELAQAAHESVPVGAHDGEGSTARRLLGADRERAFEDGLAPLLLRAINGQVPALLATERAPAYLNVLYALFLFRRGHELEPLHDDLVARVLMAERGGAPDEVAADLDQLVKWGAVERQTEAMRLRGYKDNRLRRFRYRLSDDAVALLEWLEARLAARLERRVRDARDLLADVVGALREEKRVLERWREGGAGADEARRAIYLAESVVEAASAMSGELLELRAQMVAFAGRPYEAEALRRIVSWLERFVALYLERVEELRGEIEERLGELGAPRFVQALTGCRAAVLAERALLPAGLRGGALREVGDLLAEADRFFRGGGALTGLAALVEESARQVALKIHRHLRELERRGARRGDLRAAIEALAQMEDGEPIVLWQNGLVAAAHVRVVPALPEGRVRPPAPRQHAPAEAAGVTARPLRRKEGGRDDVRSLRARRLAELGEWIAARVLGREERARLADVAAALGEGAARRIVELGKAWHLGGGRALARVGVAVEPSAGRALVAAGDESLEAPDCTLERRRGS